MPTTAITVIHKFLRREMFDFSERMFRAGPDDVPAVRAALDKLANMLDGHAKHEDEGFAPLLRSLNSELADRMDHEHQLHHAELAGLRRVAQSLDPAAPSCSESLLQLHLDWNRFLSGYLAHLDEEERTIFPTIADKLPPLAAIVEGVRAQNSREGEEFLLRLWSVTTCEERVILEEAQRRDVRRSA